MKSKSLLWLALIAGVVILPGAGHGQIRQDDYVWRSVKVGAGGFIPGIVFSRVEKNLVYLRSDMGGCYRWDSGQQMWIPLQDAMGESSYFGGESIAPDPVDADTVYIAAGMYHGEPSAILRSHDRGRTWDIFPVSFRMGGNEDGRGVGERLAIDPNDTSILFFGSRFDGLWRSADHGQTWHRVESFPLKGQGVPPPGEGTRTGLSFVVFDARSGSRGSATKTIFVGSADAGSKHLFRSDDAGKTWSAIGNAPAADMLALQGQMDDGGILYVTYGDGAGPNGVTDGAVYRFDTNDGTATDITPDKRPDHPKGGYCGLSLDREHPNTLAVATMNRWKPIDTIWRSEDGGRTWKDMATQSTRDVSASPFLLWGNSQAKLGWWMAALAIDPFDSNHAVYATGATVYETHDFSDVSEDRPTRWKPWIAGIEQTAVVALISPTEGAHLISGFGDIGGFVHDDLFASPADMFEHPQFSTTNVLDYAGESPNVIVRAGNPNEGQSDLAYSEDGGHSWTALHVGRSGGRRTRLHPGIEVSADGKTFVLMTPEPMFSRNDGKSWSRSQGLPEGSRVVADRVDPMAFYAVDFATGEILVSKDGAASFTADRPSGLEADIAADRPEWPLGPWPLVATVGKAHDLWFLGREGLFHSTDGAMNFSRVPSDVHPEMISFGAAPAGSDYPAMFAVGTSGGIKAIFRSDDGGKSWNRINDDQHQYGTRFRCITGDPRIFGRVYVGTDGRGILYGDLAR